MDVTSALPRCRRTWNWWRCRPREEPTGSGANDSAPLPVDVWGDWDGVAGRTVLPLVLWDKLPFFQRCCRRTSRGVARKTNQVLDLDLGCLVHLSEESETIYCWWYRKNVCRNKFQALTIVRLTHSPYTTKLARIRCYTMLVMQVFLLHCFS